MTERMYGFEEVMTWFGADSDCGDKKSANILLGNGFSMAFDSARFGYRALASQAETKGRMPELAKKLMADRNTEDFEQIMRDIQSTQRTLRSVDGDFGALQEVLSATITGLREALAHAVAGLHPDRPYDIAEESYINTRRFLDRFGSKYTVSYDLLLYWSIMQDFPPEIIGRSEDDGFRDSGISDDGTVRWDIFKAEGQTVHYLHGALHLFQGKEGLRKITWSRTEDPLIDQVRRQLGQDRYPIFISEGQSIDKFDKINRSAYLSRSYRSLGSCRKPLLIYGHSLDKNDDHILEAIVRSKTRKLAVSIYGDPVESSNRAIVSSARDLISRRSILNKHVPLEVRFYDAETVEIW